MLATVLKSVVAAWDADSVLPALAGGLMTEAVDQGVEFPYVQLSIAEGTRGYETEGGWTQLYTLTFRVFTREPAAPRTKDLCGQINRLMEQTDFMIEDEQFVYCLQVPPGAVTGQGRSKQQDVQAFAAAFEMMTSGPKS